MSKLLSIISITYNDLKGLEYTLASITEENEDVEHIIVDGNSTDGTKDLLKGLSDTYKWVSESDKGLYDAMNKGVSLAKGDWICFMNAGDLFADFENIDIANLLINIDSDVGVLYGDCDVLFENKYAT